jgi:hypothetical protein
MSLWFAFAQIIIAGLSGVLCCAVAVLRRGPNDYTLGATALVTVLLLIQIIVSVVKPFVGDVPAGDGLEFGMYLGTAFLMPPIAAVWALIDKSVWANVVLAVVHFAIAIMLYRMLVIWG